MMPEERFKNIQNLNNSYYQDNKTIIYHGDNRIDLKKIPDESIDLIVTDPNYGIKFMGKKWDVDVPAVETWIECLRVLKPGAFAFIMSSPRQDVLSEMIVRIRQAGFDTNFSSIYWAQAQGFPKAMSIANNISKGIDTYIHSKDNEYIWNLTNHLNHANIAENSYLKNLIEAGLITEIKDFAAQNVRVFFNHKKLDVDVNFVEKNLNEVQAMPEDIFIVVENVGTKQKPQQSNVLIVDFPLQNRNHSSLPQIVIVPRDAIAYLCERTKGKIREEEAQKTLFGNVPFWNGMDINALYVAEIETFRRTTSNQLNYILNYATKYQTGLHIAKNVIITKFTTECLISELEDILVKKQNEIKRIVDGSYAGCQLKPAVEIIIVAMKPLSEKTFVEQVLFNGKGVSWLHDCRIPLEDDSRLENDGTYSERKRNNNTGMFGVGNNHVWTPRGGRFPGNLLVSDDVLFDGCEHKSGDLTGQFGTVNNVYGVYDKSRPQYLKGNSVDSFSRYFDLDKWWEGNLKKLPKEVQETFPFLIVPKAAKSERNEGCDETEPVYTDDSRHDKTAIGCNNPRNRSGTPKTNFHPTTKPIKLMSYLITLGSREGDIILDPHAGSGTTCIAARMLNRYSIGIDMEESYLRGIAVPKLKEMAKQKSILDFGSD